jgi:hypothetical protein
MELNAAKYLHGEVLKHTHIPLCHLNGEQEQTRGGTPECTTHCINKHANGCVPIINHLLPYFEPLIDSCTCYYM